MTEYLMQETTINEMAKQIRRISNTDKTYNAAQMIEILQQVRSNSVGTVIGSHLVQVFDYKGHVFKSYYLNSGAIFVLPNPAEETGLIPDGYIFQGWHSTTPFNGDYLIVGDEDITIYPNYDTISGASEFTVSSDVTSVTLPTMQGAYSVDWGDGAIDSQTSHTYAQPNTYVIKVFGATQFAGASDKSYDYFTDIKIANTVTALGDYTFYNCSKLLSATISNSVLTLGQQVFGKCINLTDIALGNGVAELGQWAFQNCNSLTNLILPYSVTSTGYFLCVNCSSLETIETSWLGPGLELLDNKVLKHIIVPVPYSHSYSVSDEIMGGACDIPSSLKIVELKRNRHGKDSFFRGIINKIISDDITTCQVEQIVLHEGITTISMNALDECPKLKSIVLPHSLTKIYSNAFASCSSLTSAVYQGTAEEWAANVTVDTGNEYLTNVLTFAG